MEKKEPHKKLHKSKRFIYIAGAVIIILGLLGIVFQVVRVNRIAGLNRQLELKFATIRATGYPTTMAELNDYYPAVPDAENAAVLYEKTFLLSNDLWNKVHKLKLRKEKKPRSATSDLFENEEEVIRPQREFQDLITLPSNIVLGERLSADTLTASRIFVDLNRGFIKILLPATKLVKCRFVVDYSENINMNLPDYPHLNTLRYSSRLFGTKTILDVEDKNSRNAEENIMTILRISHALDNEPIVISYLTKLGMQQFAVSTLEYTLSMLELSDSSLLKLSKAFTNCLDDDGKFLNRALAGEQVTQLNFDAQMQDESFRSGKLMWLYKFHKFIGEDIVNKLKLLEVNKGTLEVDKNNIEAVKHYDDIYSRKWGEITPAHFLVLLVMNAKPAVIYKKFETEAKIKGAIIGMAVERYRLKYNKLPKKLEELIPEFIKQLPNDPFTGKPFRYVVGDIELAIDDEEKIEYPNKYRSEIIASDVIKHSGWMVYSVGKNQIDDKGASYRLHSGAWADDIPFRCVR